VLTVKLLVIVLTAALCQQASSFVSAPGRPDAAARQNPSATAADASAQTPSLEGIWQGTLEAGGAKLRMVLKVTKKPDGTLAATLDSPDQGAAGIPLDSVTLTGAAVRFELKAAGGVYEGTINKEGTSIDGRWSQGPGSFPLVLSRVERAPTGPARPQTPKVPYPYDSEEVSYENKSAGVRLAGTLTLPRAKGPHPAVLLISGSGQQDRDETVFGHKPFLVLADYLTRVGVAVLRVDDRGVGGSAAGPDLNKATSEDFAGDVVSGVEYLKSRKEIDPKKIGLVGHSEGGMIAPMVASRSADVAFIVLMAGPGMKAEEGFAAQVSALARANGAGDEAVAWRLRLLREVFAVMKEERDDAAAVEKVHVRRAKLLAGLSADERKRLGLAEDEMEAVVRVMFTPWFRFFTAYDPRATLRKVRIPVLAVAGERDLQVVPAKEHLAAVAEALKAGGNKDYTVKELPKLNHLFQTSETGSPAEYGRIEETISPAALELIGDWIIRHAGVSIGK
jgi:pimeloyl-ACP methyl ester carboxylesterase